jgi:UDP-N-acetylglucosamine diphosphorylase/glucosamine-1-phosphate N-acetyltransferase
MQYILFEDREYRAFLPISYTRPLYDLRLGIDTLIEKWSRHLKAKVLGWCMREPRLMSEPLRIDGEAIFINSRLLPNPTVIQSLIADLEHNQAFLTPQHEILTFKTSNAEFTQKYEDFNYLHANVLPLGLSVDEVELNQHIQLLTHYTDLFKFNGAQLRTDFEELTWNRVSTPINDPFTVIYHPEKVFIEEGAVVRAAILNATDGPIYIGKNAFVSEGSIVSGAHAIGEGATILMGAKLRGDSTIGPHCKIGGEVSNSIFYDYSNKSHDGFVGNSIIGSWCNLGAGTNVSNLKNNYSTVKVYDFDSGKQKDTKSQFCGLTMGDYTRCGIGTQFNTGTIVGICANVFGAGLTANFVPPFTWYGLQDSPAMQTYLLRKAFDTIGKMKARRNLALTESEIYMLEALFQKTARHRTWE